MIFAPLDGHNVVLDRVRAAAPAIEEILGQVEAQVLLVRVAPGLGRAAERALDIDPAPMVRPLEVDPVVSEV